MSAVTTPFAKPISGTIAAPALQAIIGYGEDAITLDVTTRDFDRTLGITRSPLPLYALRVTIHGHPVPLVVLTPETLADPGSEIAFDVVARVAVDRGDLAYYAPFGGRITARPTGRTTRGGTT